MTDENDKIAGTIKKASGAVDLPVLVARDGAVHTVTSSAYTSAELFAPAQADMIRAYQAMLKQADKGEVFALSDGTVAPRDIGIQTTLDEKIVRKFAEFEFSERQEEEARQHDHRLEVTKTEGAMTVELWKVVLLIIASIVVTLLGVKFIG